MTLSPKFSIGNTVYLRVSPEVAGMVVGLVIRPNNAIHYLVTVGDEVDERHCYDIELTTEKTFET